MLFFFDLTKLSPFYKGVFRAWTFFKWEMPEPAYSLFWFLEQPLFGGGKMDTQDTVTPGLTHILSNPGVVTLRRLVDTAGPLLQDAYAVADLLGLRSVHYVTVILDKWSGKLSEEDLELVRIYCEGEEVILSLIWNYILI